MNEQEAYENQMGLANERIIFFEKELEKKKIEIIIYKIMLFICLVAIGLLSWRIAGW